MRLDIAGAKFALDNLILYLVTIIRPYFAPDTCPGNYTHCITYLIDNLVWNDQSKMFANAIHSVVTWPATFNMP